MKDRDDIRWLAAVLASESNDPREWLPVGWVVRNRVEDRRYPNSYEDVALQRRQFSFFNWAGDLELPPDIVYWQSLHPGGNYEVPYPLGQRIWAAYECALEIATAQPWASPWHPDVVYFYAPIRMEPVGSEPYWWAADVGETLYAPQVDPRRFTFGRRRAREATSP